MVKIAWHSTYSHPLPKDHRFPMLKYELIPQQLLHEGIISEANLFVPDKLPEALVLLTHDETYWRHLLDLTLPPAAQRRIGLPLSSALVDRELRIAQGTVDAAHYALEDGLAFNVAGGTHHAGSNWGEGFCLLNDQAIAANYLLKNGLSKRILIVDLDVHQGNGTAQIFASDPRVFTLSVHGERNFPFRKEISDLDVGLPDGCTDDVYLSRLESALAVGLKHRPDFVFYLAGVDVLATDQLGKLTLSKAGCKERDAIVFQSCRENGLPVQVSLGGGYSAHIKDIVEAHCNTFKVGFNLFG
jgi:acetoin utilization deacetylase AcuC-like enzyme